MAGNKQELLLVGTPNRRFDGSMHLSQLAVEIIQVARRLKPIVYRSLEAKFDRTGSSRHECDQIHLPVRTGFLKDMLKMRFDGL